jgi:two-component system, chemotaxis family, chemotaxis protein CheY
MALDVLIIDDSSAVRKILTRVLAQTSLSIGNVHEAADGREALEVLKTNSVQLIFSDINMPNMDGIQFLAAMREMPAYKSTPVVMVTTEGSQTKVMEALNLGALGYVKKPFTAEQIEAKLNAVL